VFVPGKSFQACVVKHSSLLGSFVSSEENDVFVKRVPDFNDEGISPDGSFRRRRLGRRIRRRSPRTFGARRGRNRSSATPFGEILSPIGPGNDRRQNSGFFKHRLVGKTERVQGVLDADLEVEVFDRGVGEDEHPLVEQLEAVVVEEQPSVKSDQVEFAWK